MSRFQFAMKELKAPFLWGFEFLERNASADRTSVGCFALVALLCFGCFALLCFALVASSVK